ncbi:polysaccharide biosynthesis tyrosine autokinase [Cellulomonas algicola]|uniref:polysaccharide biosynthesis tyrosine autokinase n=1 Tax=Cellulomonas algicola TaxID=2071633 RepID=UPI001C3FC491|nr:polysaccharide biosynthesis tyrosine autokinase [Cellulomonas algicola]
MEPAEYLAALRKHWLLIGVLAALGFAAGYAYSTTIPSSYRATSSVYVTATGTSSPGELVQGSTYALNRIENYAQLATKPYVLDPVIEQLGLDTTGRSLAKSVSVSALLNATMLEISVVSGDPERSADIANAVATQLAVAVEDLEGDSADGEPNVQITLVGQASPPSYAFAPNTKLNAATGMALGLIAGVVIALARTLLDTRIRSMKDLRRVTDTPVLSSVRWDRKNRKSPLLMRRDPFGDQAEAFRRLRTNLRFLTIAGPSRSIVVTSSLPTEGKSTAAINLAIAMAEGNQRILLIDADLRRPSVHRYLGIEGAVGLTTVLIGEATAEDVIQPWGEGSLDVLPAGQIPPNPSELLDSPAMGRLLQRLALSYDVILLDSAPLLPVTDAAVLSRLTDGALVVVGCRTVHRPQLSDALASLTAVDARVLGLLLNQVSAKASGAVYTYGSTPQSTAKAWSLGQRGGRRRAGRRGTPTPSDAPAPEAAAAPLAGPVPSAPGQATAPAGATAPSTHPGEAAPERDGAPVDAGTSGTATPTASAASRPAPVVVGAASGGTNGSGPAARSGEALLPGRELAGLDDLELSAPRPMAQERGAHASWL